MSRIVKWIALCAGFLACLCGAVTGAVAAETVVVPL